MLGRSTGRHGSANRTDGRGSGGVPASRCQRPATAVLAAARPHLERPRSGVWFGSHGAWPGRPAAVGARRGGVRSIRVEETAGAPALTLQSIRLIGGAAAAGCCATHRRLLRLSGPLPGRDRRPPHGVPLPPPGRFVSGFTAPGFPPSLGSPSRPHRRRLRGGPRFSTSVQPSGRGVRRSRAAQGTAGRRRRQPCRSLSIAARTASAASPRSSASSPMRNHLPVLPASPRTSRSS